MKRLKQAYFDALRVYEDIYNNAAVGEKVVQPQIFVYFKTTELLKIDSPVDFQMFLESIVEELANTANKSINDIICKKITQELLDTHVFLMQVTKTPRPSEKSA